mmetsp:Transcript_15459/g.43820  ORF Transcript_15459/g.43820 Transcript_15459/m.43820 type:complete len:271 (+) Transcript_15459:205-1017(+)
MSSERDTLCIVTGASRGFGAEIVRQFSAAFGTDYSITFVLLSRSLAPMESLAADMKLRPGVSHVHVIPVDLGAVDRMAEDVAAVPELLTSKSWEHVYLFNNAGSLGILKQGADMGCAGVRDAINLNVTGVIIFTNLVLGAVRAAGIRSCFVVNTSSKMAEMAVSSASLYCSGKAARKMYHEVLALEAPDTLRVLNYGPGVMHTAMQDEIQALKPESGALAALEDVVFKRKAATPVDESCRELMKLLAKNEFRSGETVDIYDLRPDLNPFS